MAPIERLPRSILRTHGRVEGQATGQLPARVRWTRVMSVQTRIAAGYYDRDDVRDCLVDVIWSELHRN